MACAITGLFQRIMRCGLKAGKALKVSEEHALAFDPNHAVDFMRATAPKHAAAKAQRMYLQEFRKSKKALLMGVSPGKTSAEREQYAYAHPEYIELLDGIRVAVEAEEKYRWQMEAASLRVEIWRSQEASNRNIDRTVR